MARAGLADAGVPGRGPGRPSRKRRIGLGIGLAALAALLVFQALLTGANAGEDSYIAFRFAENLATGGGFAFNPGESPCEGFSSPAWVILLAAAHLVALPVPMTAQVLGVICALATMLLSFVVAARLDLQSVWFPPLLLALNADWAFHSTFGLETPLYALAVILCVHATLRVVDGGRVGAWTLICFALLVLVRPEGVAVGLSISVGGMLCAPRSRRTVVQLLVLALALLGIFVGLLLWRYSVFGTLLSNTAAVKLFADHGGAIGRGQAGLAYLAAFAASNPTLAAAIVLAPLAVALRKARLPVVTAATAGALLAVILEGGDSFYFHHWRFLVPITALLALHVAVVLDWLRARLRPAWGPWIVATAVVVFSLHVPRVYLDQGYQRYANPTGAALALGIVFDRVASFHELEDRLAQYPCALGAPRSLERRVGLWLKQNIAQDVLLATGQAGQIPYYSGLRTFDLNGLVTCEVARARDEDVVISHAGADLFLLYDREMPRFCPLLVAGGYRFSRSFGFTGGATPAGGVSELFLFSRHAAQECDAAVDGVRELAREPLADEGCDPIPDQIPAACDLRFDATS